MADLDDASVSLSRRLQGLEDELAALKRDVRAGDGAADGTTDAELRSLVESITGELQELLAVTTGGYGTIDTRSGGTITPLDPDPDAIELADIAHALSNISRFAGQGMRIYTVARHSVHVSREVEGRGGSLEAQQWGLLHDAPEAYLSDVPAPVKRSLPGYTHAESGLAEAVRDALGVELSTDDERLVDAADSAVGRYELSVHFPESHHDTPVLEGDPDAFATDVDGSVLFLDRARELGLR